jgi:mannitol-1-/sugar-/sorbitol-6-/2-deoxyglucose-6-phosphatase
MIFGPHITSIVFDMDGVLWHSSEIHAAAYRAVLAEAGLAMPDYATIAGRRTDEVMRDLLAVQRPGSLDADAVAALTAAKRTKARQLLRRQQPVDPDCTVVVETLARSRTLALASSASGATVALFLEVSQTRALFAAVVSGDDVAAAKPDPAIYVETLRRLQCEPGLAVVVEDSPSGVAAAVAAGVSYVIGIEGVVAREELLAAGARYVVRALKELVGS